MRRGRHPQTAYIIIPFIFLAGFVVFFAAFFFAGIFLTSLLLRAGLS